MTISVVNIEKEKDNFFSLTYGDIIFELKIKNNNTINSIKSKAGDVFFSYESDDFLLNNKDYSSAVKSFFDNIQMTLYHEILNNKNYNHPKYEAYKEILNESINICIPMFGLGKYVLEYNFLYIISNEVKTYMVIENIFTKEFFLFEYLYDKRHFEAKYTSYSLFDLIKRISEYKDKNDKLIQNLLLYFV